MIDKDKIQYLIDSDLEQVTALVVSDRKVSLPEALNVVYNSSWFQAINNPDTGLYYQSPYYNYELLKEEQLYNKQPL
ncbi:MAG: hypothetical protein Q4F85_16570 [Prevotella sp.]|nr:hypothetical protein [Prevotella sp.]